MQLKKSIDIDIFKDLPRDLFNVIWNYNENLLRYDSESYRKILSEELHKNVKVEQHFFSVSDQFVEKLHKKMVSYIHNFNAKGVLSSIISDGYSVTFRTVVGDMVCSLYIHMPQEKSLKWSDFCRQIIDDAIAGNFDESKYMSELDTFGN